MRRAEAAVGALAAVVLFLGTGCSTGGEAPAADRGPSAQGSTQAATFAVGRRTFEVTAPSGRRLTVDALYPTDAGGERSEYRAGEDSFEEAALDDPPVSARGRFPLVVFSHGNAGDRTQAPYLLEALASRGYVVVAPDHLGNTSDGPALPFDLLARERPEDVRAVADAVTRGTPGIGDLTAAVDAQRVGVVGYSYGGYTALAAAAGVPGARADPSVDVVVALAPAVRDVRLPEAELDASARRYLPDEALRRIRVPTLVVAGRGDVVAPVDSSVPVLRATVRGRPLVTVTLDGADHVTFTRLSEDRQAQSQIVGYVGAFLDGNLAGRPVHGLVPAPGAQVELVP